MCPEQMEVKVKIEGCGVYTKDVKLKTLSTIFNRKFNSKVEFCGSGKGRSFLCEFCHVVIAIGENLL